MSNRRQFLTTGVLGTASLASVMAVGQVQAQESPIVSPSIAQAQPSTDSIGTPATQDVTQDLVGKVALVTGARANMGRGFAAALAAKGADVVVHYHRPETIAEAEETAELVRARGRRAHLVVGDLAQVNNVRRLFDETMTTFGRVDIVVHNAGSLVKKPLAEVTEDEFDRVFGINAKGTFFIMQEAIRRIADNGRIINIGTSLLASTIGNYSAYAGSKASMEDFTRALAREIDWQRGITVNTISPGPIDTPFFRNPESPEAIAAISRLAGRLGQVNDIVPVVAFLASPQAQWINAQTIFVNGGYVAR